jgi:hypothetical protein
MLLGPIEPELPSFGLVAVMLPRPSASSKRLDFELSVEYHHSHN